MERNKPFQLQVQSYESVLTQWQSLSVGRIFMNFLRAQVFVFFPPTRNVRLITFC